MSVSDWLCVAPHHTFICLHVIRPTAALRITCQLLQPRGAATEAAADGRQAPPATTVSKPAAATAATAGAGAAAAAKQQQLKVFGACNALLPPCPALATLTCPHITPSILLLLLLYPPYDPSLLLLLYPPSSPASSSSHRRQGGCPPAQTILHHPAGSSPSGVNRHGVRHCHNTGGSFAIAPST